jgi:hypothetical protein
MGTNRVGKVYKNWLVLEETDYLHFKLQCLGCSKEYIRSKTVLYSTGHCGCLGRRHGQVNSGAYSSWKAMLTRCLYPSSDSYQKYGAKGITVTPEWRDFKKFHADMGDRPEGYSIDRIDPKLGYFKENCRWLPHSENSGRGRGSENK